MSLLRDTATARAVKAQPGGIIRCGIKVLTNKAAEHTEAVNLYNKAVAGTQVGFGMREAEIKIATITGLKNPLRPTNTTWFNLSAKDFATMGGQATVNAILEEYGEDRGDGHGRQLYRFPVLFNKSGSVDELMGASYVQGVGDPGYRSVDKDGERHCMYLEPIDAKRNAEEVKAGRKKFPPRPLVSRGACDPTVCDEFATGACKFSCNIDFRIPKVSGLGFIRLKTSSAFASSDIFLKLDELWKLCLGSPPQKVDHPIFFFTKIKKEMRYWDNNTGKMAISNQWMPIIECDADLTKLIEMQEQRMLELAKPSAAPAIALPAAWGGALQTSVPAGVEKQASAMKSEGVADEDGVIQLPEATNPIPKEIPAIEQINILADLDLDCGFEVVDEWAVRKFGDDWQNSPETVLTDLKKIEEGSGKETIKVLSIINKAAGAGIESSEVSKYLRMEVGGHWRSSQVSESIAHLDSLLKAGSEVAKSTIKSKIGEAVSA